MISTHVLDTSTGRPASGVRVTLEHRVGQSWKSVGAATTDGDGRVKELLPAAATLERGFYRLHFETGAYFEARGASAFHPAVTIEVEVREPAEHHHVPLLVTPFGYTTYRGS